MRQYDPSGDASRPAYAVAGEEDDTQEIRVEIEQTRTELSGTIDAIQQRLNPETLTEQAKDAALEVTQHAVQQAKDVAREVTDHAVQQAKEAAREMTGQAKDAAWDATVGRAEHAVEATVEMAEDVVTTAGQTARGVGSIMIDTIKQNPVPAALAALSVGWLWMNRSSGSSRQPYAAPYRPGQVGGTSSLYQSPQAIRRDDDQSTIGELADKVGQTASSATGKAGDLVSSAGDMASAAVSTVGDMTSGVASTAGEVVSGAGGTAMDAGSTILQTIKQNPVPAALTGLGMAWLYMNRPSGSGATSPAYRGSDTSTFAESAGRGGYKAGQMVGGAGEMVGGAVSTVGDVASDIAGQAQEQVQWATGGVERMTQGNPLAAGAVAIALGTAVGLTLPRTRREDQLMGTTRDNLMGQAQEATQEAMEKVQQVAEQAQTTVKQEAKAQGLAV